MANRFYTLVGNVRQWLAAATSSASASPGQLVALNASATVDPSLVPTLSATGGTVQGLSAALVSPAGSSTASPSIFGFSPAMNSGQAIRLRFGDDYNAIQCGFAQSVQMYSYHEIVLQGGSGQTLSPNFVSGNAGAYNTRVINLGGSSVALTVEAANGQSADLQRWVVNGTTLLKVDAAGSLTLTASIYFANGTTYKVDASGNAIFLSLNGTPIGATTASTGKFTTLTTTSTGTFGGSVGVTGSVTASTFMKTGGLQTASAYKAAAYTVTSSDGDFLCDATSSAFTMTLPASPADGEIHEFIKYDSSANVVTISGNGKNINSGTSVALSTQWQVSKMKYFLAKTQWVIL